MISSSLYYIHYLVASSSGEREGAEGQEGEGSAAITDLVGAGKVPVTLEAGDS